MPTKQNKAAARPIHDPTFIDASAYTVKQVAQALSYSTDTVLREIRKGKLKAFKLEGGRDYRLRGSVLNAFIAECEAGEE